MAQQFVNCPRCGHASPAGNTFCGSCGNQLPPPTARSSSLKLLLIVFGVIGVASLLLIALAVATYKPRQQQAAQFNLSATPAPLSSNARASAPPASNARASVPSATPIVTGHVTSGSPDFPLLQVTQSRWEKGGFGTVAMWRVTFHNKSKRPIGNIKFQTSYSAETGAQVDRGGTDSLLGKDTIQKVIKPGEKRTIEVNDGFVHDEAARGSFNVVSWEYVDDAP